MTIRTQAWVVERQGGPFVLKGIELQDPLEDEVLVEMVASGLCHTDLTTAKGLLPHSTYPVILGHEGSGKILKVGTAVTSLHTGNRVLLSYTYCATCESCKQDKTYACVNFVKLNFGKIRANESSVVGKDEHGAGVHGSFFGQSSLGRHAVVKANSCVRVAEDVDLVGLAPLGCGIQTGAGAVLLTARPKPESSVVISGLGGVGMAALMAANAMSVKNLIGVDVVEERLQLAKALGAHSVVNARDYDTITEIKNLTDGKGADYVIETTGNVKAARATFMALGMGGTQVQVGDSGQGELSIPLGAFLQGLRCIVGCTEGNCVPREFIPQLVQLNRDGKLPLERLTKLYRFEDVSAAIADMESGKVIKPIIVCGGDDELR